MNGGGAVLSPRTCSYSHCALYFRTRLTATSCLQLPVQWVCPATLPLQLEVSPGRGVYCSGGKEHLTMKCEGKLPCSHISTYTAGIEKMIFNGIKFGTKFSSFSLEKLVKKGV